MSKALLIDISLCVGCGACYEACKEANNLPKTSDDFLKDSLSDKTYTIVEKRGDYYVRKLCRHCIEPSCQSVCPVGAFSRTEEGAVLYDENKCMGCRYCMQACPFQIPRYEWGSLNPRVQKCILCYHRIKDGLPTACAEACPTGATIFGDREEIMQEVHKRMSENPSQYHSEIFGDDEVGGTSVIFISPVPFEQLKFKTNLPKEPLPHLTLDVLSKIPTIVTVGGTLLTGFYWLTKRKNEIARENLENEKNISNSAEDKNVE